MELRDEDIVAKIEQQENISYGINDAELSHERAEAIDYYLGEPFGNEQEGRSQVVSYDVQDTIESALPQLLKVFVSGDKVVQFEPKGPEDQDAADQETDYINHIVMDKNDGFKIFYVWFKDALLSKNGYVKVYYEEQDEVEEETYEGLSDGQLDLLSNDENIEVVEHTAYPDPSVPLEALQAQAMSMGQDPMMVMQPMLHDVKIKVTETMGEIHVKNVPPENIMISVDTSSPSLYDSRFVQHRELMPRSEVAEMFDIDLDEVDSIIGDYRDTYQEESNARDIYDEEYDRTSDTDLVLVKDTYIYIDDKLMRFVVLGNTIVYREEADCIPFACITPMIMPHRHIGRSYADLTSDIQMIKSTLIRGQLDNMYLANNGRYAISDRVNLDDMLTSRPGGIVRVNGEPGSSIMPLQQAPFPQSSFAMVEYMDSMKEKRTGITAYNQGLDSNSLNKTASGIAQVMSAAQQRLELVARTFAETGVKDLFILVHRLVRTKVTKPDIIKLRNKWVEVDPREWKSRKDLSISVGLGAGNKDQQMMHLNNILQMQKEALAGGLTSVDKIYNALAKLTQNAGFKDPNEFWTDPSQNPPAPPTPDSQMQAAEIFAQVEREKAQLKAQTDSAKLELEREQMQLKAAKDALELQQKEVRQTTELALKELELTLKAKTSEGQLRNEQAKAVMDALDTINKLKQGM